MGEALVPEVSLRSGLDPRSPEKPEHGELRNRNQQPLQNRKDANPCDGRHRFGVGPLPDGESVNLVRHRDCETTADEDCEWQQ